MGSVWRAVDLDLDAPAAVKLIDPELVDSPETLLRFEREAKAAAAIRSTHVVQIFAYGVDNGIPYIAMELLHGESLAHRLERLGKLSPADTAHILCQVARALGLAHDNGIVHRDIKPDNIFLLREGDVEVCKVLDFGIARQRGSFEDKGSLKTKTGALLGTPYYMSPEQSTGKEVDSLSDIWSYGIIAMECITGKRPFESDSIGGLFSAICIEPITLPSKLGPVPEGFDAWFARAVARDKLDRFQSIKEAAEQLEFVCRQSNRLSPAATLSASRRGADMPTLVATTATGSSIAVDMQTTGTPSISSVRGLPKPKRKAAAAIASIMTAVALVGLYIGWHSVTKAKVAPDAVSASASGLSLPSETFVVVASARAVPQPQSMATASADALVVQEDEGIASAEANPPRQREVITKLVARPTNTGRSAHAGPGSPVTPGAKAAGATPSAASPSNSPKSNCELPYVLDSQGRKYFKPECFTKH
jgi:serine/threonine-protein kinase